MGELSDADSPDAPVNFRGKLRDLADPVEGLLDVLEESLPKSTLPLVPGR